MVESLEHRVMLDGALGSEIASFSTESELSSALLDRAASQHQWLFERPFFNPSHCLLCLGGGGDDFFAFDGAPEAGGAGGDVDAPSFSDTNTQVLGVDEGDIVETDGEFVYVLSENMVTIIDVRELEHPRVTSRVQLNASSHGSDMYLHGDRLMVISNNSYFGGGPFFGGPDILIDLIDVDLAFWEPPQQSITATVIDVTNREDPTIVNTTEIDGALANSRAIDGRAYIVADEYLNYPIPELVPVDGPIEEDGQQLYVYESEAAYRERMATSILDVMPSYETRDFGQQVQAEGLVSDYSTTFTTGDPNFSSLVSVFTIDMNAEVPTVESGNSVFTNAGREIFMSRDSLYLFQHSWGEADQTKILRFEVDAVAGTALPVASGRVPGRMLDQFSADEYNGDLRIATTTGWGEDQSSGVYVLNSDGEDLEVIGSVENLAPTERIFSARFMGDRAYIVTFRQVDPLFAIDMSDATNPTVEGELKITGFSTYLQPIDENHLIGIGRDADPVTGRAQTLQLSLFDVEDLTDPQLVDRFTFEGDGWSIAEQDHHAFRYFPDYDTLAIPVTSFENGTWIRNDGFREWVPAEFNESLHVFQVDTETGFTFTDAIAHPSQVRRSVRVGDALYSISNDTFLANSITDPSTQLGRIYYLPPANGGVIPTDPRPEDIDRIFESAATEEFNEEFDMDGNSLVNADDATFVVEAVVNSHRGDTDLDGDVDFADFLQLSTNFGQEGGWGDGDVNGDGLVNFADFIILSQNFGDS